MSPHLGFFFFVPLIIKCQKIPELHRLETFCKHPTVFISQSLLCLPLIWGCADDFPLSFSFYELYTHTHTHTHAHTPTHPHKRSGLVMFSTWLNAEDRQYLRLITEKYLGKCASHKLKRLQGWICLSFASTSLSGGFFFLFNDKHPFCTASMFSYISCHLSSVSA